MLRVDVGEVLVTIKENDYLFTPSFKNLSKFGSGADIVDACVTLSGFNDSQIVSSFKRVPQFVVDYLDKQAVKKLELAIKVLECCCDGDMSKLVGSWKENKRKKAISYRKGLMPQHHIILLARVMLEYGVIGKAKVRVSMKNQTSSYTSEFNIMSYVNNAIIHLGLSRLDAENLTMTEYILLMASKYPDNDGQTQEEYDELINNYFANREKKGVKNG